MQKEDFYAEPAAAIRRTNMLVNPEVDDKIHFNPSEFSSSRIKEELTPWTFFLISGQHRDRCFDSMQYCCSSSETFEDWQFLFAADNAGDDFSLKETTNQLLRQKIDDNNNINNNSKENRLIYTDGGYTQEIRRPPDDFETIYDENTGETIVKLWQCLYPIDLKCKLSSGIGFGEEGEKAEIGANCAAIYKNEHRTLTDFDHQYNVIDSHTTNNWDTVNKVESINTSQPFAFRKCKIGERDDPANSYAKLDRSLDKTRRFAAGPCLRNESCVRPKSLNYSFPDRADNSKIKHTDGIHSCFENTQLTDQSLQFCLRNSKSHVDYNYLYDTFQSPENDHMYRKENESFTFAAMDETNPTSACPYPNQYNMAFTQGTVISNNNQSFKNVPEIVSSSDRKEFQGQRTKYNSGDVPQHKDQTDKSEVNGSSQFVGHIEHQSRENVGFKSKKLKRGCRLWEYIRNLLLDPTTNPSLIKWENRAEGTFKLVQNKKIAFNWGWKKGNSDMSYEKLSRAMRYYYKKQIFQPVIGKRLVYKFGPNATGWRDDIKPS